MTVSLLSRAFSVLHIWQKMHLTQNKKKGCQASFLHIENLKTSLGTGSTIWSPLQNNYLTSCDLSQNQMLFPVNGVVNEIRDHKYR